MNAAAVWFLHFRLIAGGPIEVEGPLTLQECLCRGKQVSIEIEEQPAAKRGPGWLCLGPPGANVRPLSKWCT